MTVVTSEKQEVSLYNFAKVSVNLTQWLDNFAVLLTNFQKGEEKWTYATMDKYTNELEEINSLIDELGNVAAHDGIISQDEQEILDEIMDNLSNYRNLVLDVLDDGKITNNEQQQLEQFQANILRNVNMVALDDGKMTTEERNLMVAILDFVEKE